MIFQNHCNKSFRDKRTAACDGKAFYTLELFIPRKLLRLSDLRRVKIKGGKCSVRLQRTEGCRTSEWCSAVFEFRGCPWHVTASKSLGIPLNIYSQGLPKIELSLCNRLAANLSGFCASVSLSFLDEIPDLMKTFRLCQFGNAV